MIEIVPDAWAKIAGCRLTRSVTATPTLIFFVWFAIAAPAENGSKATAEDVPYKRTSKSSPTLGHNVRTNKSGGHLSHNPYGQMLELTVHGNNGFPSSQTAAG